MRGELDAAGIVDPQLRSAYRHCRALHARHGRSYYLATLLLPAARRPYVHALYGFARYTDDLVDGPEPGRLDTWVAETGADLRAGSSKVPVRQALLDTLARWAIPAELVERFLASMAMDRTVTGYATYADLHAYMDGSAAAIGLQLLPLLGTEVPPHLAEPYAAELGVAFQLTNFLRDVGEDLRRGRVYLPEEDLELFGVDRQRLRDGVVDGRFRRLMAFEIARARELYRNAAVGIRLLQPASRPCVATALRLYEGILDAIEVAGYRVLDQRVSVGPLSRVRMALPGLVRAGSVRAVSARRAPRTATSTGSG